jgi:hypothetical protein
VKDIEDVSPEMLDEIEHFFVSYNAIEGRRFEALGRHGVRRARSLLAAGLRTHILVSMGSAFFVIAPLEFGMGEDALSRVIQGLTTGIGFIGGGGENHA